MKLEHFQQIFKKSTRILNFMKILPLGAELLHANKWTDVTSLIVGFSQFYERTQIPKLQLQISCVGGNYRLYCNLLLSLHVSQMDVKVKVMELRTDVRAGCAPLSLLLFVVFPCY